MTLVGSGAGRKHGANFAVRWKQAGVGVALLSLGALVSEFGSARARAHELAHVTGLHMLGYARARHLDAPRTLRVNGLPLHMISGYTADAVPSVLDFFHERCRRAGNDFATPLIRGAGDRARSMRSRLPRKLLEPIVRSESEQGGYLGCLDFGVDEVTPEDLLRRAHAFGASGDLAALGDLRFVWAMRDGRGTFYVALASEGPVPLARVFPESGDAPGEDLSGWPRPPRGRRMLSAHQEHAAPALVSYHVELAPEAAHTQYRARLIDGGFVVRERDAAGPRGVRVLEARRGEAHAAVVITASDAHESRVTLLPLR